MRTVKIKTRDWYEEELIGRHIRNDLRGEWASSSGCWDGSYLKVFYSRDEDKTYVHFSDSSCWAMAGDVVKSVVKDIKLFVRRMR